MSEANGVPVPKFSIGSIVWRSNVLQTTEQLPCPDCKGSKVWKVTTPAGETFEATCQRCGERYHRPDGVPDLNVVTFIPQVQRLTIGSIRIDTSRKEDAVSYMCRETGVGSGSVYYDQELWDTEAEAMKHAKSQAEAMNAAREKRESFRIAKEYGTLTLKDATLNSITSAHFNAWYRYNRLIRNLSELIEEGELTEESLNDVIESDHDYAPPSPLQELLAAIDNPDATVESIRSASSMLVKG